jgi:hypothetical protein
MAGKEGEFFLKTQGYINILKIAASFLRKEEGLQMEVFEQVHPDYLCEKTPKVTGYREIDMVDEGVGKVSIPQFKIMCETHGVASAIFEKADSEKLSNQI